MKKYRNYDFQQHKKSDRIKWIVTGIALLLISLTIVGVCLQLFGTGKQKPSEWFIKNDTEQTVPVDNENEISNVSVSACMVVDNIALTSTASEIAPLSLSSFSETDIETITGLKNVTMYTDSQKATIMSKIVASNNIDSKTQAAIDSFIVFKSFNAMFGQTVCMLLIPNTNIFDHLRGYTLSSVTAVKDGSSLNPVTIKDQNYIAYGLYYGATAESVNVTITYNLVDNRVVVPLPPDPVKDGYRFVGWYYDEAFTQPYDNQPIYEDTALYAKFEINRYTVTFDTNGGSAVDNQTVDWNTAVSLPVTTRDKHAFKGWFLSDNTQYVSQPIKENTTLTAQWERNVFTVTFDVNGGSVVENMELNLNAIINLPTTQKTGYTLKGWFLSDGTLYSNQPVTSDIQLTAQWEIIMCTVTFYVDGSVYDSKQVEYGTYVLRVIEPIATKNFQVMSLSLSNNTQLNENLDELTVSGDLDINLIELDNSDKVKNTILNNWIKILVAVVSFVLFVVCISVIVSKSKKLHRK